MSEIESAPFWNEIAEIEIIAACLMDQSNVGNFASVLEPSDFYSEKHRNIWKAVKSLYDRRDQVELYSIFTEMKTQGTYVQGETAQYITELSNTMHGKYGLPFHLKHVKEASARRKIRYSAMSLSKQANDPSISVESLASNAYKMVSEAQLGLEPSNFRSAEELLNDVMERMQKNGMLLDSKNLVNTGLSDLDRIVGGLRRGYLTYIGARPSKGKSVLVGMMALNIACKYGPVGFFANELQSDDIVSRWMAQMFGVPSKVFMHGKSDNGVTWESVRKKVESGVANMKSLPVGMTDKSMSVAMIRDRCQKLSAEKGHLSAICIDRLELLQDVTLHKGSRYEAISAASNQVKALSKEFDTQVICAVQFGRTDNAKPELSHFRDSGHLEADCQVGIAIWSDEDESNKHASVSGSELHVIKNTNGRTGFMEVGFNKEIPIFFQAARTEGY